MQYDSGVVRRVLDLLRKWGWEAGLQRLKLEIAETDTELDRQALEHFVGWMAAERGDYQEAAGQFTRLGEIPEMAGWAAFGLGFVAMRERDLRGAAQRLEEADAQAGDDPSLRGLIRLVQGTTLFHQGKLDSSLARLEEAAGLLNAECFSRGRALDALGMWYAAKDNFQAAMAFFQHALEHKRRFDDEAGLAVTHGQLGRMYLDWGHFDTAEQHFRQDLEIACRIGDARGEAQMYNYLGLVALARQEAENAAAYLDHSIALSQAAQWRVLEGYARKDRALVWLLEDRVEPAEKELRSAERHFVEADFAEGVAHVNRAWGVLHRMTGEWMESEQRLRRALQTFETSHAAAEVARTYLEIARTREARGAPLPLVRDAFLDAMRSAEQSRRPHLVQQADRELTAIDSSTAARQIYRRIRGRRIDEDSTSLMSAELEIVTVFFFDLQGFTAWSRNTDPSVVILCLNQMMATLVDVTVRHEVQVIEYMGDGFLALARGPYHAHRAVRAALELNAALDVFNRPRRVLGLSEFSCRIGVSTGEVVLGNVGTYEKIDYRAVGAAVNLAARLQNEACPGKPCLSRATWESVQDDFVAEETCPRTVTLKGLHETPAWDLVGPRDRS